MQIIKESDKNSLDLACNFLRDGKIISFACDTVYGVAVDASNFKAVESLYKLKNRAQNKPIAIFLKDLETAKKIFYFDKIATEIAQKHLPGSLTLVLEMQRKTLPNLTPNLNQNDDGFLGFRITNYKFVQDLLEKFSGILAVTSANLANENPAINAEEVEKYFNNISLLIDGGTCEKKIASTVAKISNNQIKILRQGSVNL